MSVLRRLMREYEIWLKSGHTIKGKVDDGIADYLNICGLSDENKGHLEFNDEDGHIRIMRNLIGGIYVEKIKQKDSDDISKYIL